MCREAGDDSEMSAAVSEAQEQRTYFTLECLSFQRQTTSFVTSRQTNALSCSAKRLFNGPRSK